jgi:hypothetical protein
MTLSYFALALAIVLLLAGIAGTVFTFRNIAQRHEQPHNINTQMWHGIGAPLHGVQFAYLIDIGHGRALFSRLFYRVAYYVALGVAAIERIAVSFIQLIIK